MFDGSYLEGQVYVPKVHEVPVIGGIVQGNLLFGVGSGCMLPEHVHHRRSGALALRDVAALLKRAAACCRLIWRRLPGIGLGLTCCGIFLPRVSLCRLPVLARSGRQLGWRTMGQSLRASECACCLREDLLLLGQISSSLCLLPQLPISFPVRMCIAMVLKGLPCCPDMHTTATQSLQQGQAAC